MPELHLFHFRQKLYGWSFASLFEDDLHSSGYATRFLNLVGFRGKPDLAFVVRKLATSFDERLASIVKQYASVRGEFKLEHGLHHTLCESRFKESQNEKDEHRD